MLGGKPDRPFLALSGGQTIGRRFDAVGSIALRMIWRQRIAEALDDRAVDFGGLACHLQANFLCPSSSTAREQSRGIRWKTEPTGCARIDMSAVFQLAGVVNDLLEYCDGRWSLPGVLAICPSMAREITTAHHVHNAVDPFEFDPGRGGGRLYRRGSVCADSLSGFRWPSRCRLSASAPGR